MKHILHIIMIGVFICLSFKILGFRRDPERICFRSIPMKFYKEKTWSWLYLGALSLVDATGATVTNTYVAPTPTPTPTYVPVPTLAPLNPPQTGGKTSAMILLVFLAGVSLLAFAGRSRKRR